MPPSRRPPRAVTISESGSRPWPRSSAARAGVKKARAEAKAAPVRVEKEAEPAPKRAKVDSSLNIRVRDQTGEEVFFKVQKTTRLNKVFTRIPKERAST